MTSSFNVATAPRRWGATNAARRRVYTLAAWLLTALCPALATAAEADIGLKLLDRDSLAGWQYGAPDTSGWSVREGVLHADSPKHSLLSGWTLGDFELRFRFAVAEGGSWTLELPKVPTGMGPHVVLSEGGRQATFLTTAANTISVRIAAARDHSAVLTRRGNTLSISVDGQANASMSIPESRVGLSLAAQGQGTFADLELIESAGEPIFNGRDLTGWYTIGKLESWPVEDGKIVCINKDGNYLRTEKLYGNFTLSLEYKITTGGNSGVGIRTPREGWPSGDGMELQLLDEKPGTPMTRHSTMAIYGNLEPLAKADKPDQWNRVTIKADGYMISAWVNGVLVQQADTSRLPELKHRHLSGWIGLQDHGVRTEFRNLRVLEAPSGVGLTAWQSPRPLSGAELVLDRMMNLDVLTRPDDSRGHALTREVKSSGEEVVAELRGPGAVVELSCESGTGSELRGPRAALAELGKGRLSLYFDGSPKPAVDCPVGELPTHLPLVGPESGPLLTYVPFEHSLKITATHAAGDRYRLLYVTFPGEVRARFIGADGQLLPCVTFPPAVQVEKFAGPEGTVPRGWLPAISYRYQQHGWGGSREQDEDLDPRQASVKQTLEPGKRVSLVKLDGAGIVEWFKLHVPGKVLAKDELWLEVRVDGEASPSVAAPARFLFPGLAGGSKYQNFVVLYHRDHSFLNRLPMPFERGIELSAVNRGKRPIKDVELSVSVDRKSAPSPDSSPRYRLRAVFQRGSEKTAAVKGPGRWVGLVYRPPEADANAPVLNVTADSKAVPGWSGQSLNTLFAIAGRQRQAMAGQADGLIWGWLIEAPLSFESSLDLQFDTTQLGDRLALFYVKE